METKLPTRFFLGANSPGGFQSLYSEFTDPDSETLYILKGGPGCGKSTLMRSVGRAAEEAGLSVEYIHCSGDPMSLDGVRVPERGLAWVDGTPRHRAGLRRLSGGLCKLRRLLRPGRPGSPAGGHRAPHPRLQGAVRPGLPAAGRRGGPFGRPGAAGGGASGRGQTGPLHRPPGAAGRPGRGRAVRQALPLRLHLPRAHDPLGHRAGRGPADLGAGQRPGPGESGGGGRGPGVPGPLGSAVSPPCSPASPSTCSSPPWALPW